MELLLPGTMMADLTELVSRAPEPSQFGELLTPSFLILTLGMQVVVILALWMSSKAVLEFEGATFGNAIKVWFLNLLVVTAMFAVFAFVVPMVMGSRDSWRIGLVIFGAMSMALTSAFLIPMKVYVITFPRAFTLLLLAAVIEIVGVVVVGLGMGFAGYGGAVEHNQQALMELVHQGVSSPPDPAEASQQAAIAATNATNEIDGLLNAALHPAGAPPSLDVQEQQVATLQEKLQARRNALTGDPHEQAIFQNEFNRYMYFLNQVKALRRVISNAPAPAGQTSVRNAAATDH